MPPATKPAEERVDTSISPRCSACRKAEYELKGKMKRCAGCSAAIYCSKECQKKEWPQHKLSCRAQWTDRTFGPVTDGLSMGHPPESVAAIEAATLDWLDAHEYELKIIATATVYLHGGFSQHFSGLESTRALAFVIQPLPSLLTSILSGSSDDSPAKGFHLLNIGSMSKAEFLTGSLTSPTDDAALWDRTHAGCRKVEATIRGLVPHMPPGFVRVIPALFNVTHSPTMRFQAVILLPQVADRTRGLDAETSAVFEDIRSLCIALMAKGLVLRVRTEEVSEPNPSPDVGVMVRRKKKRWEWEAVPGWDWGHATATDVLTSSIPWKTKLQPDDLWRRFYSM